MESSFSWVTFQRNVEPPRRNNSSVPGTLPVEGDTNVAKYKVSTRQEARVLAGKLTKETRSNWLVQEHDGYFEVVETQLVPNFKIGDRVHWKEAPEGIIGIVRREGIGPEKIVKVYWGTQDAREFIGDIPSRQLELDAKPSKTNYS